MNRLEWVLGIFLVVLLLVMVGLGIMLWTQPTSPDDLAASGLSDRAALVAPTPVFQGDTARTAYARAEAQIQSWQADAILFSATATWPQGATIQELIDGASTWSLTFYSPANQTARPAAVVEEQVTLMAESRFTAVPDLTSVTAWEIDSDRAVQIFLAEGGQEFMRQHPVTTLHMTLGIDAEDGRYVWSISLLAELTEEMFKMKIDAANGEVRAIDYIQ